MTSRSAQMIVDTYGNAPAWMIYSFFNTLAPTHHLLDKFVGAYRSSARPGYIDTFRLFERWLHSDVPMAGRIFLETSEMWRENSLMKGTMKIGGSVADLTRVACPLLNVIGDKRRHRQPDVQRAAAGTRVERRQTELALPNRPHGRGDQRRLAQASMAANRQLAECAR